MKIYEESLHTEQNLTWLVSQKKKNLTWFSHQP